MMVRMVGLSMVLAATLALAGCGASSELKEDPLFQEAGDIYQSAAAGDLEGVQYFMFEESWDPGVANYEGLLPLSSAAQGGNVDIIYLMVQNGADVNLPDLKGKKPLQYAKDAGHEEAVKLLQELGATE